ncbi:MAG TPA: Ig-like domain-containing protein [Bacteroidia bacterium]
MKRNRFFWLFAISYWLLANECAQIIPPNGGQKDITPPRAIKYIPDSAQTNFKSKNIVISFDEYIQLTDLQKQLMISPPMVNMPDVKVKGKMLYVSLKDTLLKNTTYALNFGNAIRDITENNPLENFQYVFSTGSFIDSLSLKGTVLNAADQKPEKGVLVMLYDRFDDSIPYKKLPSYFSRTKEDGSYKINNIKAGRYKIFALKDANANYLYDTPAEQISFSDTLIEMGKSSKKNLLLFKEVPKKQKLKKATIAEHGHAIFAFAKPLVDSLKLEFLSQKPKVNVVYEYSKEKDTLHYWFADDLKDSMKIKVSEGNKILDTVYLRPLTLEQTKNNKRGEKWGLRVRASANKNISLNLNEPFSLSFSHPLLYQSQWHGAKQYDSLLKYFDSRISIKQDSSILSFHDSLNFSSFGNKKINFQKVQVQGSWDRNIGWGLFQLRNWKENTIYHLFIKPGTFTDIFGLKNDTIKIDFKTQEEKYYGTLKLSLKTPKTNLKYILQLLDENNNLVDQQKMSKAQTFNYAYLAPGKYKLRIICDDNDDGKWTTGNYLMHQQPEKIIFYPKAITIRSNWDLELEWKLE